MKQDFVSSARSVSDLKAHLVLTTKYRKKVFTGAMIVRLHDIMGVEALLFLFLSNILKGKMSRNEAICQFSWHRATQLTRYHPDAQRSTVFSAGLLAEQANFVSSY